MTPRVRERVRFLRSFVAHPQQVGALLPTSRRAVRDMLDLADPTETQCVVELGAGTGACTRELLARLRPDASLLAFEVDPDLAEVLSARCPDPRLRVVLDSAVELEKYLEGTRPEVIVSALPFSAFPADLRRSILQRAHRVLAPGGVMLVLQYSPAIQRELTGLFGSVRRRFSPFNVPPAFLFACQTARRPDPWGMS